jgi:NADH-quinone oxidoreductase subunit A
MGFDFGAVVAVALVAIGFALGGLTIGRLVRPHFPDAEKASVYECGERPIGSAWMNFNPRFYLIALVFVIFEVEIALTFPVVAVYKDWLARGSTAGMVALVELLLFTGILLVGLAWVWVHCDLEWVKKLVEVDTAPPAEQGGPRQAA